MRNRRSLWWALSLLLLALPAMAATSLLAVDLPDAVLAFREEELGGGPSRQWVPPEMRGNAYRPRAPETIWLVHDGETWQAFSGIAYPYRCPVEWDEERALLYDSCHHAVWDRSGRWVAGPPRWLDQYPVSRTVRGDLLVNLSKGRRLEPRR